MQINRIDSKTNFNGIKLKTVTLPDKKIDIYSLDGRDKRFITRMVDLIENNGIPRSTMKIGEETTEQVVLNALKKAAHIKKGDYTPKVLISVENNKYITGILQAEDNGDIKINGMAVWNKDKITRKSLLHTMLDEVHKLKDFSLIIPLKEMKKSMRTFCRELGFTKAKDYPSSYLVDAVDMERTIKNIESSPDYNATSPKLHGKKFVDLEKIIIDGNS